MRRLYLTLIPVSLILLLLACTLPQISIFPTKSTSTPEKPLPEPDDSLSDAPAVLPDLPQPSIPIASGPYAIILIMPGDALNIHTAPGTGNPKVGSFSSSATQVMRTGPSALVGEELWVEVQQPDGATGWVDTRYLSEYVSPTVFCADSRVTDLLTKLGAALAGSDGQALAALGSPQHGVDVRYWRYGRNINFGREHLRWVFDSTYVHNWGTMPGSGDDTIGSFREIIRPGLLDIYQSPYKIACNEAGIADAVSMQAWPEEYGSLGFMSLFKPATPGIDLDWRVWLAGVEYVDGQPYLFSLIHFQWEP